MLDNLFTDAALFFSVPAMLGTGVFLLKLGLMAFAGIGADMDAGDVDVDADLGGDVEHGDSTAAFKLLSIQSIAAFCMGFGWGGLSALIGFDWSVPVSLAVGAGIGAGFVWLEIMLMKLVYDLQSSGNVNIDDAIDTEGSVYVSVPQQGTGRGQVRVIIGDRARIYNAVTEGDTIATGSRVRVVRINDDRTLTVSTV